MQSDAKNKYSLEDILTEFGSCSASGGAPEKPGEPSGMDGEDSAKEVPDRPAELPEKPPATAPAKVPAEIPAEVPAESPVRQPVKEPPDKPAELPHKEPGGTPPVRPSEIPVKEPADAPPDGPIELPGEQPDEAPVREPAELPSETAADGETVAAGPDAVLKETRNGSSQRPDPVQTILQTVENGRSDSDEDMVHYIREAAETGDSDAGQAKGPSPLELEIQAAKLGYSADVVPEEPIDESACDFSLKVFEKAYKQQQKEIRLHKKQARARIRKAPPEERRRMKEEAKTAPVRSAPEEQPVDPHSLLARLSTFSRTIKTRTLLSFALCLLLAYLCIAPVLLWPLPIFLHYFDSSYMFLLVQLTLLVAVTLCGIDVFVNGLYTLVYLKPSGDTLLSVSALASMVYTVMLIVAPSESVYLPVSVLPALGIAFSLAGDAAELTANVRSLRCSLNVTRPETLTLSEDGYGGAPSYFRSHSGVPDRFYRSVDRCDIATRAARVASPVLLLTSLVLAAAAALRTGGGAGYFLWALSVITAAAPPLGLFISASVPYGLAAGRMFRAGAACAGPEGLRDFSRRAPAVITERDLFPGDSIVLTGFKLLGSGRKEQVIGYTASLLDEAGCALGRQFVKLAAEEFIPRSRVGALEFSDNGGISAEINGDRVIVGTASFMYRLGLRPPEEITLRTAVFCAVNMELCGVFAVKYNVNPRVERALKTLARSRRIPVLASRDFNVTAALLSSQFNIASSSFAYPELSERISLSNPDRVMPASGVLLMREGLDPIAETLEAGRRYGKISAVNLALSLFASAAGTALISFFAVMGGDWIGLASPLNLLVYELLCVLPVLLVSGWVSKY